jgi:hypothetical protein
MRAQNPALLFVDRVDQYGRDFFEVICVRDLEGIVAKHDAGRYDASAKWIKIKNRDYSQVRGRHELFRSNHAAKETHSQLELTSDAGGSIWCSKQKRSAC